MRLLALVALATFSVAACGQDDVGAITPLPAGGSDASAQPGSDAGPTPGSDAGLDAAPSTEAGSDAGPSGPCPAPVKAANETEVFGDAPAAGWSVNGFQRATAVGAPACSGTSAAFYTSRQYDGVGFSVNTAAGQIDAGMLRFRIYVDRDAVVSAAAAPLNPPQDIHKYFLLPQTAWSWKKGWNTAEFAIPATFGKTGQILFEVQSCSAPACDTAGANPVMFRIDDLRLVAR